VSGIRSTIVAGTGQTLHEIEFDVPERLRHGADIEAFHAALTAHL
jgi:hypothetical protein